MSQFQKQYNAARRELQRELKLKSIEAVPRLTKISISVGAGAAVSDANYLENIGRELTLIAGQKPVARKARKSIAGFKLRAGMPIGLSVTLRGKRMYDFLNKLINVALPRVRDFRGVSTKSFDGQGNYTLGIREHIVFPEVVLDNVEKTFSLAITIATNAGSDELAQKLFSKLNFPFRKDQDKISG